MTGKHWGRYALCGALIGAGAILPGISGGVLAAAFGVYRPFMEFLGRPKTAFRRHWRVALPLAAGWVAGFVLIARGLNAAMNASETLCVWLFLGLIAGSVPALWRDAGREGRPRSARVCMILSAAALWTGLFLLRYVSPASIHPNFLWRTFCGMLWGVGTVLPGFSASPVMMALGLYQPVLDDLSSMRWRALAECLPGAILAASLLARGAEHLFRTRYAVISHAILGLVCASALSMTPTRYRGAWEIVLSAVSGATGFALARLMERFKPES